MVRLSSGLRRTAMVCAVIVGLIVLLVAAGTIVLVVQGKRQPSGEPLYVAMGSSFAAGIGLGDRAPDSPFACMRTINSYPAQLASKLGLSLVNATCSAATTTHILDGGQYFQRPQLDAVTPATKLVTVTSGGNDVGYVGDLSALAAREDGSLSGWLTGRLLGAPDLARPRDFGKVRRDLATVVQRIRQRAPDARVVLVTYLNILPPEGTCTALNITAAEAGAMRKVGDEVAAATRDAARDSGALLVDMQHLGAAHNACSPEPWVNGWKDPQGTSFHPNLRGAQAMAAAIAATLVRNP